MSVIVPEIKIFKHSVHFTNIKGTVIPTVLLRKSKERVKYY